MSEVESRPTRGRSSTRGGRGSNVRGGLRGGRKQANGHANDTPAVEESLEDEGELGEMKKKYLTELSLLKDMFPDWTDTDLVFALEEADGDIPATVDKITQGAVSQFSEVKKPKDRARSKVNTEPLAGTPGEKAGSGNRARGRGGFESSRGGRGRGAERGRGGHRGGRGGHATTNGSAKDTAGTSVPTAESSAWDTPVATENAEGGWDSAAPDTTKEAAGEAAQSTWSNAGTSDGVPPAASKGNKPSLVSQAGPKKSWASMFAAPKPAPAPVSNKTTVQQAPPADLHAAGHSPPEVIETSDALKEPEPVPPAPTIQEPGVEEPDFPVPELPAELSQRSESEALELTPSADPLTEENVEHLPDASVPPSTLTAASTTGSIDPRNLTPLPQAPIGRPSLGGFATSANRLAGTGGRSASFQRRVKEQQEAVVMPGHSAVDRATVQFGSMGLNGEPGLDVDDEREDPETRQPPQHSPPSQPRTSLPPAPRQASASQESAKPEGLPTPKQAPGLPPASAQNQQQIQDPSLGQSLTQDQQINQYNQYGRYGQNGLQQDSTSQGQQKYDPFGQPSQQSQQSQYDQYSAQQQHQQHAQQQPQSSFGVSSAQADYPSYYTSDQQRYNPYYGTYGHQDNRSQTSHSQRDPSLGHHGSSSGFGTGPSEPSFASQPQQQAQSRYGDAHAPGSGNDTPNPVMGGQQHQQSAPQSQHSMQHQQNQSHQPYGANSGYPYGHPAYNSPYQYAYQSQFSGYNGQPYGGYGSQGKQANPYGGNHAYNANPSHGYDAHSASPAPTTPFGGHNQQSLNRGATGSSALGGLEDYTRTNPHSFGAGNDYARSSSVFGSQTGYGQQQNLGGGVPQQHENSSDVLKPFGSDSNSIKNGPSPRPSSTVGGQQQSSGLPPPQSSQQHTGGFGAAGNYQGFSNQGGQYLGGLGAQQSGQQSAYGGQTGQQGYGGYGGFNQYGQGYGNNNNRGGWGQNYSQGH